MKKLRIPIWHPPLLTERGKQLKHLLDWAGECELANKPN
jgi:hypothetical protein